MSVASEPSPEGVGAAAELIAEEPERYDEDHIKTKLEEVRQFHGEEWDDAREKLLGALAQMRKARGEVDE